MRRKFKIEHLAAKLLAVRKHLGFSQSQLARQLAFQPSYNRVSEYERGRRQPSLPVLLSYARLGGIHIDDLIDDSVELTFIKQQDEAPKPYPYR